MRSQGSSAHNALSARVATIRRARPPGMFWNAQAEEAPPTISAPPGTPATEVARRDLLGYVGLGERPR